MLRALLEERFQLKVHEETKEGPAYALLAGDKRAKLNDFLEGHNASMDQLAKRLADLLHRPVLNQTGISDVAKDKDAFFARYTRRNRNS